MMMLVIMIGNSADDMRDNNSHADSDKDYCYRILF